MVKRIYIPTDFNQELPDLKNRAFQWSMKYSINPENKPTGNITYYSAGNRQPGANLILIPGLASNSETEPLMRVVTYWGLKYKYNIFALDTFLGDFEPAISADKAEQNTFPALLQSVETGLNLIQKHCENQYSCVIAHSIGATAALEVLNQHAIAGKPAPVSAGVMFAPYVSAQWHTTLKGILRNRFNLEHLSDAEFNNIPIGLSNPHALMANNDWRYISIKPNFLDDAECIPDTDAMAKYTIPITLVAGGRDRKAPIDELRSLFTTLQSAPNGNLFRFVEFPDSKHSFLDQHKDWSAILRLIQSQHIRRRRQK